MKNRFVCDVFPNRLFIKVNSYLGMVKALRHPKCIKAEVIREKQYYVTFVR